MLTFLQCMFSFLYAAKRKFAIDEGDEVTLMDKNGAEVDEDALIPLVEMDPSIELMVLKAGEKWGKYPCNKLL